MPVEPVEPVRPGGCGRCWFFVVFHCFSSSFRIIPIQKKSPKIIQDPEAQPLSKRKRLRVRWALKVPMSLAAIVTVPYVTVVVARLAVMAAETVLVVVS